MLAITASKFELRSRGEVKNRLEVGKMPVRESELAEWVNHRTERVGAIAREMADRVDALLPNFATSELTAYSIELTRLWRRLTQNG